MRWKKLNEACSPFDIRRSSSNPPFCGTSNPLIPCVSAHFCLHFDHELFFIFVAARGTCKTGKHKGVQGAMDCPLDFGEGAE
jgi:hypothetical protein